MQSLDSRHDNRFVMFVNSTIAAKKYTTCKYIKFIRKLMKCVQYTAIMTLWFKETKK